MSSNGEVKCLCSAWNQKDRLKCPIHKIIVNEVYNKTKLENNKMENEFVYEDQEMEVPEQEEEEETVETQDDGLYFGNFQSPQIEVPEIMKGF